MAICNNKKCSLGECDQAETCTAFVPVMTNADRIRNMSDAEMADLIIDLVVEKIKLDLSAGGHTLTATQIGVIKHTWFKTLYGWLKQPGEEK